MIVIDTTPLVALCDARDAKHRAALADLESMAAEDFAVCEAVLTEVCFHLPHRNQRLRLRGLLRDLNIQALPMTGEPTFWLDVFDWLAKYSDHDPDWADACLAMLRERNRTVSIWTYDREFRTTWRRLNGTVIPLAVRPT